MILKRFPCSSLSPYDAAKLTRKYTSIRISSNRLVRSIKIDCYCVVKVFTLTGLGSTKNVLKYKAASGSANNIEF